MTRSAKVIDTYLNTPDQQVVTVEFVEDNMKLQTTSYFIDAKIVGKDLDTLVAKDAADFWAYRDIPQKVSIIATHTHQPGRYRYIEKGTTYILDLTADEAQATSRRKQGGSLSFIAPHDHPAFPTTATPTDLPALNAASRL